MSCFPPTKPLSQSSVILGLEHSITLPRPEDFGGTDDAAVRKCLAYAQANTGYMVGTPGTIYEMKDQLIVDQPVVVQDMALDFTDAPFIYREPYGSGGLVQFQGSFGAKTALTQDSTPALAFTVQNPTASLSGNIITWNTNGVVHGLSVGDAIWTSGGKPAGTPQSQWVYYTQNLKTIPPGTNTDLNLTVPFIVTSVDSPTQFRTTCTLFSTNDANLTNTPTLYLRKAANVVKPASMVGWYPEQRVQIVSEKRTMDDGGTKYGRIGEFASIKQVMPDLGVLVLYADVRDNYLVSEGAGIIPMSLLQRPGFKRCTIIGHGKNVPGALGDLGVNMYYCEDPVIEDYQAIEVDHFCGAIVSCFGGRTQNWHTTFNGLYEAGRLDADQKVEYGFGLCGSTEGHQFINGNMTGGRHVYIAYTTAGAGWYGTQWNNEIVGGVGTGQWYDSICTQLNSGSLRVDGFTSNGSHGGINNRGGSIEVTGCWLDCFAYAFINYYYINGIHIHDNPMLAGKQHCVRIEQADSATTITGPIRIMNNFMKGGQFGTYIYLSYPGASCYVQHDGNLYSGQSQNVAEIRIGDGSAGSGWNGSYNNNSHIAPYATGTTSAVLFENALNVRANGNQFLGPVSYTNAFQVFGAQSVNVMVGGSVVKSAAKEVRYDTGAPTGGGTSTTGMNRVVVTVSASNGGIIDLPAASSPIEILLQGDAGAGVYDINGFTTPDGMQSMYYIIRSGADAQQMRFNNAGSGPGIKLPSSYGSSITLTPTTDTAEFRFDPSGPYLVCTGYLNF
jgi:hypothetical protein